MNQKTLLFLTVLVLLLFSAIQVYTEVISGPRNPTATSVPTFLNNKQVTNSPLSVSTSEMTYAGDGDSSMSVSNYFTVTNKFVGIKTNNPVVALDILGASRAFPVTIALTGTSNAVVNCTNGNIFLLTLTTNINLQVTNALGGWSGILLLRQDSTGSRTMTYNATYIKTNASITSLSSAAGALDVISFIATDQGTNVAAILNANFK